MKIFLTTTAACLVALAWVSTAVAQGGVSVGEPAAGRGGPADGGDVLAHEVALPPGFVDELLVDGFLQANGFDIAADGRVYIWEQGGLVWVVEDGQKLAQPFLDLSEEVGFWSGHGLLGLALDPDFLVNGHVYLLYVVDYHHLEHFGTPAYDPGTDEYDVDTIGRITRYTGNAADGYRTADPSSRFVLLGQDKGDGFPICSPAHGVGGLVFGDDGTLLASCGDTESPGGSETCVSDGILTPSGDVARFRAQHVDNLGGKVIRIDAQTGDGLSSNPFYDPLAPRAPRSRVWAVGLRNPFRMTLRRGSGSPDPAAGDPGTLYLADVGNALEEELNVAKTGGLNFGWPMWEGMDLGIDATNDFRENLDAPNPLFGLVVPGVGLCDQEFFHFQDLIVQDTQNAPFWPNPCDPSQPIVTPAPLFVHARPALSWLHGGGARVPVYDVTGEADVAMVGDPTSPVVGTQFGGNCSIAGTWYTGTEFPVQYRDTYFHGDYGLNWIFNLVFDADDNLLSVDHFYEPAGRIVDMKMHPDGSLYFIDFTNVGLSQLRRISYSTGNLSPTAKIGGTPPWGPGPLTVTFDGSDSSDPEGMDLDYRWDFADGTPHSILERPTRVFPAADITDQGTIIAKVFELNPPGSMGWSNPDPEVIRDGDRPPVGTADFQRQYDTAHWGPGTIPDKGGDDWIGYEFTQDHEFIGLLYQEGTAFDNFGGWWAYLEVQVRVAGRWESVVEQVMDPVYPGVFIPDYETFEFRFAPTTGDAIRLWGIPAGTLDYVSIGELRAIATPSPAVTQPTNYDVTLTVTDPAAAVDAESAFVSLNNTPPAVSILTPVNLKVYSTTTPDRVKLRGQRSDTEHGLPELDCTWQIILHHDNHTHPGPMISSCFSEVDLQIDGCPDVHFQEVRYTVSDPMGLARTVSHFLIPDCDLNHNGVDDATDIASGFSLDLDLDGVPDEVQVDCNGDGTPDIHQVFFGYKEDANGNGVLDECEDGGFSPKRGGRGGAPSPGAGSFPPMPPTLGGGG